MTEKDIFSMKFDALKTDSCICPHCNREIEGLENAEEFECPFCEHEFEVEYVTRQIQ